MENQSLIPSPNDNGGKQKKGYGPIVAASLALLLGLSFYMGRQVGGAHLRHGEMGMTNAAAASSSSMSLVGSGTAASNLKTLTIALDDDDVIEGLLSGWLPPGNVGGDVIPIDGLCDFAPEDCTIPPGMTRPNCVCLFEDDDEYAPVCFCSSGQPGAFCAATSDCVKPPGLDHPVCRSYGGGPKDRSCQSGQPGSLCGVTDDCVVPPGLEHAVCRKDRCQQ